MAPLSREAYAAELAHLRSGLSATRGRDLAADLRAARAVAGGPGPRPEPVAATKSAPDSRSLPLAGKRDQVAGFAQEPGVARREESVGIAGLAQAVEVAGPVLGNRLEPPAADAQTFVSALGPDLVPRADAAREDFVGLNGSAPAAEFVPRSIASPEYGIGNRILPDRHADKPLGGGIEAGYGIGNRHLPDAKVSQLEGERARDHSPTQRRESVGSLLEQPPAVKSAGYASSQAAAAVPPQRVAQPVPAASIQQEAKRDQDAIDAASNFQVGILPTLSPRATPKRDPRRFARARGISDVLESRPQEQQRAAPPQTQGRLSPPPPQSLPPQQSFAANARLPTRDVIAPRADRLSPSLPQAMLGSERHFDGVPAQNFSSAPWPFPFPPWSFGPFVPGVAPGAAAGAPPGQGAVPPAQGMWYYPTPWPVPTDGSAAFASASPPDPRLSEAFLQPQASQQDPAAYRTPPRQRGVVPRETPPRNSPPTVARVERPMQATDFNRTQTQLVPGHGALPWESEWFTSGKARDAEKRLNEFKHDLDDQVEARRQARAAARDAAAAEEARLDEKIRADQREIQARLDAERARERELVAEAAARRDAALEEALQGGPFSPTSPRSVRTGRTSLDSPKLIENSGGSALTGNSTDPPRSLWPRARDVLASHHESVPRSSPSASESLPGTAETEVDKSGGDSARLSLPMPDTSPEMTNAAVTPPSSPSRRLWPRARDVVASQRQSVPRSLPTATESLPGTVEPLRGSMLTVSSFSDHDLPPLREEEEAAAMRIQARFRGQRVRRQVLSRALEGVAMTTAAATSLSSPSRRLWPRARDVIASNRQSPGASESLLESLVLQRTSIQPGETEPARSPPRVEPSLTDLDPQRASTRKLEPLAHVAAQPAAQEIAATGQAADEVHVASPKLEQQSVHFEPPSQRPVSRTSTQRFSRKLRKKELARLRTSASMPELPAVAPSARDLRLRSEAHAADPGVVPRPADPAENATSLSSPSQRLWPRARDVIASKRAASPKPSPLSALLPFLPDAETTALEHELRHNARRLVALDDLAAALEYQPAFPLGLARVSALLRPVQ